MLRKTWRGWVAGGVAMFVLGGCGPGPVPPVPGGPGDSGNGNPGAVNPWPADPLLDYSAAYRVGTIKSASLDDAYNLWLLDGSNRVGVLRAGDTAPRWFPGLGQAARGFQTSVVCGGAANRAYVGYLADELADPGRATAEQKSEGDADYVRLNPDGTVEVEQHLNIVNSNDRHFDETRSILSCAKVMRGPFKGELYFGTNHAVTRVRGTDYSDHRHPVWSTASGSLRIGYNFAVSVTRQGDVFLGNEWKIGLLTPRPELQSWIDVAATPWKLDTFVEAVGTQEEMDYWRATAQTVDGRYFLGSRSKGLWELQVSPRRYTKVQLPTENINALADTDDGSLFIGTGAGLWRMGPDKVIVQYGGIPGRVTQLFYDPTSSPSMLLVVAEGKLYVLRGH